MILGWLTVVVYAIELNELPNEMPIAVLSCETSPSSGVEVILGKVSECYILLTSGILILEQKKCPLGSDWLPHSASDCISWHQKLLQQSIKSICAASLNM